MKKTLIFLLLFTACSRASTTTTTTGPIGEPPPPPPVAAPNLAGASSPRAAVEQFLNGARTQDIQAMGVVFGTARGPARDNMSRDELEKRLIILQCHFSHDKFRILRESAGEGGRRVIVAELTRGTVVRSPSFYTVPGPGGRFFLENMEIAAVRDFCRNDGR